jgi:hypothetical protein
VGDALWNERALFQEGNLYFDFKLRTAKRRRVQDNGSQGTICIGEGNAENENRPNFRDHAAVEQPDFAAPRRHVLPHGALLPARRLRQ